MDLGRKRTGLAWGNQQNGFVFPIGIVQDHRFEAIACRVLAEASERKAQIVVLGYPLQTNGSPGEQAAFVQKFARFLTGRSTLPIRLMDERLTSKQIESVHIDINRRETKTSDQKARTKRSVKAKAIDASAASIILESYMQNPAAAIAFESKKP